MARDGERVLVHGGTSGIGTMAIMLAKAFGMEVIVTCGDAAKCAAATRIGADLAINYRETDFAEAVMAHTAGKGVNIVLDMVSGDYVARNCKCLAEDGRHVTIAVLGGAKADINMALVMMRRLTLTGSTLRPRTDNFKSALADEIADNAWPLFADGELSPVMDMTFPLAEAAAAHARMEAGEHIGKIDAGGRWRMGEWLPAAAKALTEVLENDAKPSFACSTPADISLSWRLASKT